VEGHSDFPFFTVTAQLFGPANTPLTGRYRYEITMRDQAGNGWDITAQFEAPETAELPIGAACAR
jgi:hypothetical protein